MATIDLVIDFGTSNTTIYQKGIGIVLKDPSVAVIQKGKRPEIKYSGAKAKAMYGKTASNATIMCPVKEGTVVSPDSASLLIRDYISKILPDSFLRQRINALIPVPCGLTLAERRSVENTFTKAGINEVTIIDSPLCAYQAMPRMSNLIVDIGGGTTEIACVTQNGIINGCSLNIAGDAFSQAIVEMVEKKYLVSIGIFDAEKVKHMAASLYENDMATADVTGRDITSGYPKTATVKASDIREAILPLIDKIIKVIKTMINMIPREIASELCNTGIVIMGGSAQLPGLDSYLANGIQLQVTIADDPINSVAIGGGRLYENKPLLCELLSLKKI